MTPARLALGLLFSASALAACGRHEPPPKPPTPVRVHAVAEQSGPGEARYSGTIRPNAQVDLAFKVSGYVREILRVAGGARAVQEGDPVSKGTVLARIREADYALKVKQAKAQLAEGLASREHAKSQLAEAEAALEQAGSQLAQALAAREQAGLELDRAKALLETRSLPRTEYEAAKARFDEVGALAGPGTVAFVLADTASVKAVFGVPDVVLPTLKLGSSLGVTSEALRSAEFRGRVTRIAPSADPESRVFEVELTIPNPGHRLKVGMIASLKLPDARPPASGPVVPLAAIVRSQDPPGGYAVFVVAQEGGTTVAHRRAVRLGEALGNMIAVTDGVKVGEKVVVAGASLLVPGAKVVVVP